jgi:hypothetical protein
VLPVLFVMERSARVVVGVDSREAAVDSNREAPHTDVVCMENLVGSILAGSRSNRVLDAGEEAGAVGHSSRKEDMLSGNAFAGDAWDAKSRVVVRNDTVVVMLDHHLLRKKITVILNLNLNF